MKSTIELMERGLIPDPVIRMGIRRLLGRRLHEQALDEDRDRRGLEQSLRRSAIALHTGDANAQHYEVPAEFFARVLGPHMKYSAGWWPPGVNTLAGAEAAMLDLTCERAGIAAGQRVLDLGCGWGSLSLWIAGRYPGTRVTALSNSHSQRRYIEARAAERGLANLQVLTADINDFATDLRFDRVVSVEMFEHMRNYALLLERVAGWLEPGGRLFVHMFTHRQWAYPFEARGDDDWMARHFFTGGIMPSVDLLVRFQDHMRLEQSWQISGVHYQQTCEAWLANLDRERQPVREVLAGCHGAEARRWYRRWRVFFMACAELFGYRGGSEWGVTHYLFTPRRSAWPAASPPACPATHRRAWAG